MMKSIARITAATLLLLVWIAPGLIQAAETGPCPAWDACAFSPDGQIQKEKKRPPQKPETPPEKKQPEPRGKPEQPPQQKEKEPAKKPYTPPAKEKDESPPIDDSDYGDSYYIEEEPDESPVTPLPKRIKRKDSSPLDVFSDIESGWRHENVNMILKHFGKGKVSIAIGGIGLAGGRFSKSQSFYLLKDLFKYTLTKKFEFVQFRNVDSGKRRVYAVAERYYKRTDDGRLFKDKIFVSLNFEDNRWVINEIKSIE
jgi:hypothetical protein